jgi:hypothetical protein
MVFDKQLRFEAPAEKRETLDIEPIPGSGDDVIGADIHSPSIPLGHAQHGPGSSSLSFRHGMIEHHVHSPENPFFQPPGPGWTKDSLHAFQANSRWQATEEHRRGTAEPQFEPLA